MIRARSAANVTENGNRERGDTNYGAVSTARIATDRGTGRARGFGFVEMSSQSEAQAAIAGLNGKEVQGRTLTVNEAKPREDRSGGGNRGGVGNRW